MRARHLAPLLLALAACGDTLIDHSSPLADPVGNGCDTVAACGPECAPCADAPPEGGIAACLGERGAEQCGYECQGGLIKCAGGCCPATQVAAGEAHTCAIAGAPSAGDLYCWGANEAGQVTGTSATGVRWTTPRKVRSGVTAVALGRAHTCALVGGAVQCWGAAPAVPAISGAKSIAAGGSHTCAIDASDAVRCWGGAMPATPIPGGASALTSGADHACALVGDAVRCWGQGESGQLGIDPPPASSATPVDPLAGAAAIGAGSNLTCAATVVPQEPGGVSDALQCWGSGLGLVGSPQLAPTPPLKRADRAIVEARLEALAVGRAHVCVQRRDAVTPQPVECLGLDNDFGQLAVMTPTADLVAALEHDAFEVPETPGALSFAVGADHGCAVLASGALRCWGRNSSGQLGDGTTLTPGVDDGGARTRGLPVPVSGR